MANTSSDIDATARYRTRSGRGVYKKKDKSICAQITIKGKNLALGTFKTLAAARAKRATVLKQIKKNGTAGRDNVGLPSQRSIPSCLLLQRRNPSRSQVQNQRGGSQNQRQTLREGWENFAMS